MKTIAFFNNKGGVGKTSLCYHIAWMYSELGKRVIAVDLDPQANLSAMFLDEDRLEQLWPEGQHSQSIFGSVEPLIRGTGDISNAHVEGINQRLGLIVGDLSLASFEAELSSSWPDCMDRKERGFRIESSFFRIIQSAGHEHHAELALIDVGPNLGAINRAALLAADFVVMPLAADLFSIQGLKNLGPTLYRWREEWKDRLDRKPTELNIGLPEGRMEPLGYVAMQHAVRGDRPVKAYQRWMERIPTVYANDVLKRPSPEQGNDLNCLATLKNYRSLMPFAQDAQKPMFLLKPADGAIGGHMTAVQNCYRDFKVLAEAILQRI